MKTGDILSDRYRIVRTLGAGATGTVYQGEDLCDAQRVAIKLIHRELAGDAAALDAWIGEARVAGGLGHPGLAAYVATGRAGDGAAFVAHAYVDGEVLTDEIYRLGGLPVRRAVRIADRICAALAVAHDAGVVHRHLTSDNVLVAGPADAVTVLDFGAARLLAAEADRGPRGAARGTPEFMAPEQLIRPTAVDQRGDIYALGVVLYEMLTARRPFSDDDRRALQHRVIHELPPPLLVSDVPAELEELIVVRLLAKEPERRPATMHEVRAALAMLGPVGRLAASSGPLAAVHSAPASGASEPVVRSAPASGASEPVVRSAPASGASEPVVRSAPASGASEPVVRSAPASGASEPVVRSAASAVASEPVVPRSAPASSSEPLPPAAEVVALPDSRRRAPPLAWAAAALVAAGAAIAVTYVDGQARETQVQAIASALDGDAEKLANLIEGEVRTAQLRASGIATLPVLRAAIETDAATIRDLAASEPLFAPRPGEVLELFQLRARGALDSVLRLPATAAPLAPVADHRPRIESDGTTLAVAVAAPIVRQQAGVRGAAVIAIPLDLAPIRRQLARHARAAQLIGFGKPVPLVGSAASGNLQRVAVPLAPELRSGEVALAVAAQSPPARGELGVARLVCWTLCGLLIALFAVSSLRGRRPTGDPPQPTA